MPGFNHTGPEGKGPRTGRKLGNCKATPGSDSDKSQQEKENLKEDFNPQFGNRRRFRNQGGQNDDQGNKGPAGSGMGRGRGRGRGRGQGRRMGW